MEALAARLDRLEVATVAVCLLNAYVNSEHETRIADYLARTRPALKVSPLERAQRRDPRVRAHLHDGAQRAADPGRRRLSRQADAAHARPSNCLPRLLLVQSNGGVCSADTAAREPVRLLLSGPSGGSAACALLSQALGEANLVGVDMGGTSFDVSVVRDGRDQSHHPGRDRQDAGAPADGGDPHHRRRRRLDRHGARGRTPDGRAGERRLASGSRLLRPRRHEADRHRRQPRARPARRRRLPRRRHAARRRQGAGRHRRACGAAA